MCKGTEVKEAERIPLCLRWSDGWMRQVGPLNEAMETTERNLVFVTRAEEIH